MYYLIGFFATLLGYIFTHAIITTGVVMTAVTAVFILTRTVPDDVITDAEFKDYSIALMKILAMTVIGVWGSVFILYILYMM